MGNIGSIRNALNVVADDVKVVSRGDELGFPDAVVVPGVGSFAEGIKKLREHCFIKPLTELVVDQGVPYLGICLGLQFLADCGKEGGDHEGFGWIPGTITQIKPREKFDVPHIGWNSVNVESRKNTVLFNGFNDGGVFYFVHSYHLNPVTTDNSIITAQSWHGTDVTAAIAVDNIFGVQFHPEKSQDSGIKLLDNFVTFAEGGND